jgi:hypothetical protein
MTGPSYVNADEPVKRMEFHPISLDRLKSLLAACAANGGESVSQ